MQPSTGVYSSIFILALSLLLPCNAVAQASIAHLQLLPDVLAQHPLVLSADQQRQAAQQDSQGARWQYFPTPSVGAENSNPTNRLLDSRTRFVRLQQPLWTGGRLDAQMSRASAQQLSADAGWHEQRYNLTTRWLELWAETAAAKHRITAYTESEQQHQRYVQLVHVRAQEGQIARSEVQLALTRLASVQADLEQARAQYQQGLSKLQQMLGKPWPADHQPDLPSLNTRITALPVLDTLLQQAFDHHPLVQKYRAQILVAQSDVDLARSRLAPEIYARAEIVHGDITGEVRKAYIGMSTNFGGGLSSLSAVSSAQNRVMALEQDFEARRKDLSDQIATDLLQHRSQSQRYKQLHQAQAAADAYLQSSETQFSAGRRSWQELMNSAREKAQLRVQLADTWAQAWLTGERLRLTTQGLDAYLSEPTLF